MSGHQSTIPSATLDFTRDHITKGEEPVPHLYLDSNGNPTIGTGFKVRNEKHFATFDVKVTKDGKLVSATEAEKRQAYRQIIARKRAIEKEAVEDARRAGKKTPPANPFQNRKAESYEKDTNTRMQQPAQNARLNREIVTRTGEIRAEVGGEAWNKLTRGQKAAILDLGYNTGDGRLKGFPKLKQAIIKGDAKAMARESIIQTDSKTGTRNIGRLVRNRMLTTGESESEATRNLMEQIEKLDKKRKEIEEKKEKDEDNGKKLPGPEGTKGDDTSGPAGDAVGDTTGTPDAEVQQARAQKRRATAEELSRSDGELDEILAKRPEDLTEFEAKTVMRARMALPSGTEQRALEGFERVFWDNAYGTGPAKRDATGRMIDAPPRRPLPVQPLPSVTPDGEPLNAGVRRIADAVAGDAERDGKTGAVKALQTGINLVGQLPNAPALRVDGVAGPRTRRALRIATARSGPKKVADGVALGRFSAFADAVQSGRADAGGLGDQVGRQDAALALQSSVNGLGRRERPLRLDGRIGPKTTSAFASTLTESGADRLTRRFGKTLGLL